MHRTTLAAALLAALAVHADSPNRFQPRQMSSEAIFVGILTCSERAQKEDPKLKEMFRISYCACVMDATRLRGPSKTKPEDMQQCATETAKRYVPY